MQRLNDRLAVLGAAGLQGDLDPGLAHVQRHRLAHVVGVHDVAAGLRDQRQQRRQATGPVRDRREQAQAPPGGRLVALGDRRQQAGVDVAAGQDNHGRAAAARA